MLVLLEAYSFQVCLQQFKEIKGAQTFHSSSSSAKDTRYIVEMAEARM